MRILICIAAMEGGGAERQVAYLAKALVEAGEEVHVALIRGGVNLDRLEASGATIHFVDVYPRSFRFVIPLMRLLRHLRPDIVYLWQRPFDVLGAIACLGSGVACVQAERTEPGKLPRGVKAGLRRLLVPFASGVISNSETGHAYWQHRLLRRGRAAMISNIVPIDELSVVAPAGTAPGGAIAVGRLDSSKNVLTLVKAVARLKRRGIVAPLLIVGEGPLYSTLDSLIADFGLSDHVVLCGYRTDAWSLMKSSSVFVSLSHYEGEPNAVLEAVALGCGLLLSDIPAHRALGAADGATFVNPDSVEEVAVKLEEALQAGRAGTTGGERLVRDRAAAAIGQRHIDFFREVRSGSGARVSDAPARNDRQMERVREDR